MMLKGRKVGTELGVALNSFEKVIVQVFPETEMM